jgi:hypothetical protein
LGFEAWVKVEDEEMELMIDLMDALATWIEWQGRAWLFVKN